MRFTPLHMKIETLILRKKQKQNNVIVVEKPHIDYYLLNCYDVSDTPSDTVFSFLLTEFYIRFRKVIDVVKFVFFMKLGFVMNKWKLEKLENIFSFLYFYTLGAFVLS